MKKIIIPILIILLISLIVTPLTSYDEDMMAKLYKEQKIVIEEEKGLYQYSVKKDTTGITKPNERYLCKGC